MQGAGNGLGAGQGPLFAVQLPFKKFIDVGHQTLDIDNRMAGKDLRQSIGQIAGKTFARPLDEMKGKMELLVLGPVPAEFQRDIIGAFRGVTEQGIKKIIGSPGREEFLERIICENIVQISHFQKTSSLYACI